MHVLIVDDHEAIHYLASNVIKKTYQGTFHIHQAKSVDAMLSCLDSEPIELVILDLVMPGPLKRVGLIQAIAARTNAPKILVYSGETHQSLVRASLHAGASGYVPKGAPMRSLLAAIEAVANGGTYVDSSVEFEGSPEAWARLSAAEREVLREMARGKTPKEIAAETGRAYSTVANIRGQGLEKLGLRCTEELSTWFYRNGLEYELDPGYVAPLTAETQPSADIVPIRPGNLTAAELETCETMAYMVLKLDEPQAKECMKVTDQSVADLKHAHGPPVRPSALHAWRFPATAWVAAGVMCLAIDLGERRVFYSSPTPHAAQTSSRALPQNGTEVP